MQSLVAHIKIKGVGVYDKELYETPKDAYWSPFCLDGPGYGIKPRTIREIILTEN